MLATGPAKKVCIYLNEDTRHNLAPLYQTVLTYLLHHDVAGATAYRAMAGFGSHRELHTPQLELLSEHLPIRIEFIESLAKVEEVMPALFDIVSDGMIEVHDTIVLKNVRK